MKKIWQVFAYEYQRHVFRKRFIFALVSMPIIIAVFLGIAIFSTVLGANFKPLGYVDHSGLLAHPLPAPKESSIFNRPVDFLPFASESDARTALENGNIQGYYVLDSDYLQSSRAELYYLKQPADNIQGQFNTFLQTNLLASQPPEITNRIAKGDEVLIQSPDGTRQVSGQDIATLLLPFFAGILVMIVILTSGGYLLQAVVEEKENRTMEIVITSVSPEQLMAGKILGNIAVGLTQMIVWIVFVAIGIWIGKSQVDWLANFKVDLNYVLIMIVTAIPAFILIGSLMAAVGASVTESREAQSITGLFTLPVVAPYWVSTILMAHPNGPLAIGMSFFPLTAPVTISLRAGFTQIPTLQLIANLLLLWVCAAAAIWLAARTFRLGMLRYGKRLTLRQIFSRAA
jgi:ABC-2 type transport system permease protein